MREETKIKGWNKNTKNYKRKLKVNRRTKTNTTNKNNHSRQDEDTRVCKRTRNTKEPKQRSRIIYKHQHTFFSACSLAMPIEWCFLTLIFKASLCHFLRIHCMLLSNKSKISGNDGKNESFVTNLFTSFLHRIVNNYVVSQIISQSVRTESEPV